MTPEMRKKLATLIEIEGFDDVNALFAAAITDSDCPAICCNPDNPDCDYTAKMEPEPGLRLMRSMQARYPALRARARRSHLMTRERYVYALSGWAVDKREHQLS
jgi:hypothetical protein